MAGFKLIHNHREYVARNIGRTTAILLQNTQEGLFILRITMNDRKNNKQTYSLGSVIPGDRIRVEYFLDDAHLTPNIEEMNTTSSMQTFALGAGQRYGIDTFDGDGKKIRLSYPEVGGITYMITFSATDHARVFAMAGDEDKAWNWVIDELYDSDSADLTIVATDWCDPYPSVEKRKTK